jgi:uncharacterized protein YlxW (UPF0749 family)
MFEKLFGKKSSAEQTAQICKLEDNIDDLKKELETLKAHVEDLQGTLHIVTYAQYEIGNDVGMIYKTLKSLSADTSSDDRLFGFKTPDDDEPYLN